jgi:hypothetical protein
VHVVQAPWSLTGDASRCARASNACGLAAKVRASEDSEPELLPHIVWELREQAAAGLFLKSVVKRSAWDVSLDSAAFCCTAAVLV